MESSLWWGGAEKEQSVCCHATNILKQQKYLLKFHFFLKSLVVCSALVSTAPMYSNWGLGCIYQVQVTSRHF